MLMIFPLFVVVGILEPDFLNFKFEALVVARIYVDPRCIFKREISHLVYPALATSHLFKRLLLKRQHQTWGVNFDVDFVISEVRLNALRDRVDLTLQLVKLIFSLQLRPFI